MSALVSRGSVVRPQSASTFNVALSSASAVGAPAAPVLGKKDMTGETKSTITFSTKAPPLGVTVDCVPITTPINPADLPRVAIVSFHRTAAGGEAQQPYVIFKFMQTMRPVTTQKIENGVTTTVTAEKEHIVLIKPGTPVDEGSLKQCYLGVVFSEDEFGTDSMSVSFQGAGGTTSSAEKSGEESFWFGLGDVNGPAAREILALQNATMCLLHDTIAPPGTNLSEVKVYFKDATGKATPQTGREVLGKLATAFGDREGSTFYNLTPRGILSAKAMRAEAKAAKGTPSSALMIFPKVMRVGGYTSLFIPGMIGKEGRNLGKEFKGDRAGFMNLLRKLFVAPVKPTVVAGKAQNGNLSAKVHRATVAITRVTISLGMKSAFDLGMISLSLKGKPAPYTGVNHTKDLIDEDEAYAAELEAKLGTAPVRIDDDAFDDEGYGSDPEPPAVELTTANVARLAAAPPALLQTAPPAAPPAAPPQELTELQKQFILWAGDSDGVTPARRVMLFGMECVVGRTDAEMKQMATNNGLIL